MKLTVNTYIHKILQQLTVKIICNVTKTIILASHFPIQRKINKKINKLRIGRRTNAVYCSSSFVRAASSSNLFSKVNQRSSAIRGRSEGKVAKEFAILEIWKFELPTTYRWLYNNVFMYHALMCNDNNNKLKISQVLFPDAVKSALQTFVLK